jgi:hypothetical protein
MEPGIELGFIVAVSGPTRRPKEDGMATTGKFCRLCEQPATLEQRPTEKVMAVSGCDCGAFDIGETLWDFGIKDLTPDDRQLLSERIRRLRDAGGAVRVVPKDGQLTVEPAPSPALRAA